MHIDGLVGHCKQFVAHGTQVLPDNAYPKSQSVQTEIC